MPRFFGMVLRWALLPFLVILALAMASGLWHAARNQGLGPASLRNPLILWLLGGIAFRILFRTLLRRFGREDPLDFIDTLEHELTHALMGYLTFAPPESLSASLKSGGEVQLRGSNPLATLAPYFLPLWCGISLLLGMIIQTGMQATWDRVICFLLGWFGYRLAREYRWRQTDLHAYGFLFSTVTVFILLLAVLGLILHARGFLAWNWLPASGKNAWLAVPGVWSWFRNRLAG